MKHFKSALKEIVTHSICESTSAVDLSEMRDSLVEHAVELDFLISGLKVDNGATIEDVMLEHNESAKNFYEVAVRQFNHNIRKAVT